MTLRLYRISWCLIHEPSYVVASQYKFNSILVTQIPTTANWEIPLFVNSSIPSTFLRQDKPQLVSEREKGEYRNNLFAINQHLGN